MRRSIVDSQFRWMVARILLLVLMWTWGPGVVPVLPQSGVVIQNHAEATFSITGGGEFTVISNTDIFEVERPDGKTKAITELLRYDPSGAAAYVFVRPTGYLSADGSSHDLVAPPSPCDPARTVLDEALALTGAAAFRAGDVIFIRISDQDQNRDNSQLDSVQVTLRNKENGDWETLVLSETSLGSGIFVGWIPYENGSSSIQDGRLSTGRNTTLWADYTDSNDSTDRSSATALVDPFGVVFDSTSGQRLSGVAVTLIDQSTGQPATVFGSDGHSAFPSTVQTGSSFTEAGIRYEFSAGEYSFPVIAPGSYRIEISVPQDGGYSWPTRKSDEYLQRLASGPYALSVASRGEAMTIGLDPVRVDIALDPRPSSLFLVKSASKLQAGLGDFLQYRLEITNSRTLGEMNEVTVTDILPGGFRYQPGSARLDGLSIPTPAINKAGRIITFNLGVLKTKSTVTLTYVAQVAAAKNGPAINRAQAHAALLSSNEATATVLVYNELILEKTIVLGSVEEVENGKPTGKGLPGVKVFLEDGSFAVSDNRGMFHLEGLEPGAHVVQLDRDTLPAGYKLFLYENDPRSGGRPGSRFLELSGGMMWQETFYAEKSILAEKTELPPKRTDAPLKVTYDQDWIERQPPGWAWVVPEKGFMPPIPSLRIVIKHSPQESLRLLIDGKRVDNITFDGVLTNRAKTVSASVWSGVEIPEGDCLLQVVRLETGEKESIVDQRRIHMSSPPVRAQLDLELSTLVADGRTAPVLAIRLTDRDGYPARQGTVGVANVHEPYARLHSPRYSTSLLAGAPREPDQFVVGEQGVALVRLEPTSVSSTAVVTLSLLYGDVEVSTPLRSDRQNWILVGFAEGSATYETIGRKLEPVDSTGIDSELSGDARIALYAKGRIRGGCLLTLTYDSDKHREEIKSLHGIIDPDAYYLVYGDQNGRRYDAPSTRKWYLQLERDKVRALIGDTQINWSQSELSTYRRDFNGLRADYVSGRINAEGFVTNTGQAFTREEIRGQGISGAYQLSHSAIVQFSELVEVEIRDRLRSELVLSRRSLAHNLDYIIDYRLGTIFLREPLFQADSDFNHQFLVIRYEVADDSVQDHSYGIKIEAMATETLKVAATHIQENAEQGARLSGFNMRYQPNGRSEIKAEFALSDNHRTGQEATAYFAEISHRGSRFEGQAYIREEGKGFGLGQMSPAESGTRKASMEGAYKLGEKLVQRISFYREEQLDTGNTRNLVEASSNLKIGRTSFLGGLRWVQDSLAGENVNRSVQITSKVAHEFAKQRLRLRVEHEQNFTGSTPSVDYPTRTILGLDVLVNPTTTFFTQQEWTYSDKRDTSQLRSGLKLTPWKGGNISGSAIRPLSDPGVAVSAAFTQRWALTERFILDFALERSKALGDKARAFDSDRSFSSVPSGDFKAFSVGTTYNSDGKLYNGRIEWRGSKTSNLWNLLASRQVQTGRDFGLLTSFKMLSGTTSGAPDTLLADLRLGAAYRPSKGRWTILERLDFIRDTGVSVNGASDGLKSVNNLNLTYRIPQKGQISFKYGIKYARELIDDASYSGVTHFFGLEGRRNLSPKWDIGVHGNILQSFGAGQDSYGYGFSLGRQLAPNSWVSAGYNFNGFRDTDFDAAGNSKHGVFVNLRIKFDQESLGGLLRYLSGQ